MAQSERFERAGLVEITEQGQPPVVPLVTAGMVAMLLLVALGFWLASRPTEVQAVSLGGLATTTVPLEPATSTPQPRLTVPLLADLPAATATLPLPPSDAPLALVPPTLDDSVMRPPPTLTPAPTSTATSTPTNTPIPTAVIYRSDLTGLVIGEQEAGQRALMVMIDNHPDAAPQSGLSQASLVIEALAEGGITRFAALFDGGSGEIAELGPVRSARIYYVDYALPFSPLYIHAGGSPAALDYLHSPDHDLIDLNLLAGGPSWRSSDRLAPHNLYAASPSLRSWLDIAQLQAKSPVSAPAWPHKDDQPPTSTPLSSTISFSFSQTSRSDVTWTYQTEANRYLREQWGYMHIDRNSGEQLTARNVVIISTTVAPIIGDEKLRIKVNTVGEGDALFALDGSLRSGKWRKESRAAPLTFTYADGSPVAFNRGNVWIEVLPADRPVEFK